MFIHLQIKDLKELVFISQYLLNMFSENSKFSSSSISSELNFVFKRLRQTQEAPMVLAQIIKKNLFLALILLHKKQVKIEFLHDLA